MLKIIVDPRHEGLGVHGQMCEKSVYETLADLVFFSIIFFLIEWKNKMLYFFNLYTTGNLNTRKSRKLKKSGFTSLAISSTRTTNIKIN